MARILHTLRHNVRTLQKPFIPQNTQVRSFWEYVNMMFNKPDVDRLKQFGPDRTCAEWVLRNGGKIVWDDGTKLADYNALPHESKPVKKIMEIDGSNSGISHYGFPHLAGCTELRKVILHNSTYIDNQALEGLQYGRDTITYVQVSKCPNVNCLGIRTLHNLHKLETLVLYQLKSVVDLEGCKRYLREGLPKVNIIGSKQELLDQEKSKHTT